MLQKIAIPTALFPMDFKSTKNILTDPLEVENAVIKSIKKDPKRVILRLRVAEFEGNGHSWEQHVDAIRTYLIWADRPINEYEGDYQTRRHYAHVEPFQAPELNQKTFHVILDMEQHSLEQASFDYLPHEIYRVRRDQTGYLYVMLNHLV